MIPGWEDRKRPEQTACAHYYVKVDEPWLTVFDPHGHNGKWCLACGEDVIAVYDTAEQAMRRAEGPLLTDRTGTWLAE